MKSLPDLASLTALEQATLMPTYARNPVCFVRGERSYLYDIDGKEYLDCIAGLATVSVGHANPEVAEAVSSQMSELVHVTNLYYTHPQLRLALKIQSLAGWGQVFMANSGSEANECAIKLARMSARVASSDRPSPVLVALEGSFHGRTMGSLSITGQPSKQRPFEPLLPEVRFVPRDDPRALANALDGASALFLEVIQGEGGVREVSPEFVREARRLCDDNGSLLVVDEVQTGLCRTGNWLAFLDYGVEPDVYTLGKALGNGLPVAACVARPEVAGLFSPGDHGTTMGGGPVVSAAASKVIEIMERDGLAEAAKRRGSQLAGGLLEIPGVASVRGRGLLVAAETEKPAQAVTSAALELGLLVNPVSEDSVRFAPPLVISEAEIDRALEVFEQALKVA